jgi:hypothetical protein
MKLLGTISACRRLGEAAKVAGWRTTMEEIVILAALAALVLGLVG